eukprot:gene1072-1363_t
MKAATAQNRRCEEIYLRAMVNSGMGWAKALPLSRSWIDQLQIDALLPALRRIVRRWLGGAGERKRQRVANFTRG